LGAWDLGFMGTTRAVMGWDGDSKCGNGVGTGTTRAVTGWGWGQHAANGAGTGWGRGQGYILRGGNGVKHLSPCHSLAGTERKLQGWESVKQGNLDKGKISSLQKVPSFYRHWLMNQGLGRACWGRTFTGTREQFWSDSRPAATGDSYGYQRQLNPGLLVALTTHGCCIRGNKNYACTCPVARWDSLGSHFATILQWKTTRADKHETWTNRDDATSGVKQCQWIVTPLCGTLPVKLHSQSFSTCTTMPHNEW